MRIFYLKASMAVYMSKMLVHWKTLRQGPENLSKTNIKKRLVQGENHSSFINSKGMKNSGI